MDLAVQVLNSQSMPLPGHANMFARTHSRADGHVENVMLPGAAEAELETTEAAI